jgi:hypothetical protein
MIRCKPWKGNDLEGKWHVTRKLDGVRALRNEDGSVVSRNGKPLYNLDHLDFQDVEVFAGSWEESVSLVRTKSGEPVPQEFIYHLNPLDERLDIGIWYDPSRDEILSALSETEALGDEGLVLRQGNVWLKVKSSDTFDVQVTDVVPGRGKHTGRMGALMTERGKVGTGFTDAQRSEVWRVGEIIEVECMSLTPSGKFRHPRFVRRRFDK